MQFFLKTLIVASFLCLNVYGLRYTIRVSTSRLYFTPHEGTFKLYIHGTDYMDKIILRNQSDIGNGAR